ncbi:12406_t:CDS:2 [Ambispora leptoticha]|uniref:12406_t:CDS:1 n=1 Tax=Ambispora leptoticha TaxID=144679 RepID=A0A9N9AUX2_9GLOM|nr:12406_t:CDS:2 [Ambispora leptoticha]
MSNPEASFSRRHTMTDAELVEIRTFEGAYWRTCLSAFGFALVVLRIFEPAFYRIGLVFVAYGGVMLCIAAIRRQHNMDVFDSSKPFVTSGGYVLLAGIMGLTTYIVLLTMILNIIQSSSTEAEDEDSPTDVIPELVESSSNGHVNGARHDVPSATLISPNVNNGSPSSQNHTAAKRLSPASSSPRSRMQSSVVASPSNHYNNSHYMNPPPNHYSQVTLPTSSNPNYSIASSRGRPNSMNHHQNSPALRQSISTHGKSPARALRAHTVNLVGESMFVFGGCDARTCFNNVYIFDADTMYWCKPRVYGDPPPACRAHSSALVDKKLYIFGGGDGPIYFNDLYIFDTDSLTWSRPFTTGDIPTPRRAHTTAYYNNRIYVFGGGDGVRALNDVYVLNISNLVWEKIETLGCPPISRGYHTSNLVGSKLVVYGGSDGHECFKDVHVLNLENNTWHNVISMETSYPRLSHTATQIGSYLFVVCGHDGTKYTSDVLLLNLVTMQWEARKVYGTPPSGRGYHSAVLYDSRLFVFGGYDGHSVFDDVFVLDLSACAYLPQITNFQLPGI